MTTDDTLVDRYGAPSPARRRALIAVVALVAAAFLGWLAWSAWAEANPEVDSQLIGYSIEGEHAATATVYIDLADPDVKATCTLQASAEDHSVVGQLTFTPSASGRFVERIRTEREATSVDMLGCTAPGQNRPR